MTLHADLCTLLQLDAERATPDDVLALVGGLLDAAVRLDRLRAALADIEYLDDEPTWHRRIADDALAARAPATPPDVLVELANTLAERVRAASEEEA